MSDYSGRSLRTSVFIVAAVRLYREGLAASLATCPRVSVVGACANRADARQRVLQLRPDVLIVDIATRDSLELIRDIRGEALQCNVLAFAVDEIPSDIIECAEAGATGYVTSNASINDLMTSIERIARAELVCSPQIAAELFRRISQGGERWSSERKTLTTRERQVLDCIRQGKANKEIAQKLSIAEPTVKNHVHHLLKKLDVTTRAQAAAHVPLSSSHRRAFSARTTG